MNKKPLSRREFMQMTFAAMGTAAAAPLAGTLDSIRLQGRSLQIGAMLPHAKFRPLLAANILDGLRLGFGTGGYMPQVQTQQIGAGADSAVKAARILLDGGAKIVVGMVGMLNLEALQPVFAEYDATLVLTSAGENFYAGGLPNILVNSLQYGQSAYATGAWGVEMFGPRGMILASLYESGFDTLYAAEQGIAAAGGTVIASRITHANPASDRLADALDTVRTLRPDFVYAAYNGAQAADFLAAYHAAGLEAPLAVSPFMLEDIDSGGTKLHAVAAWASEIDTIENREFLAAFNAAAGRSADSFAVLGYETGRWIAAGLDAAGTPSLLRAAMLSAEVIGPRGLLKFDAAAQTMTSALSFRTVDQFARRVVPAGAVAAARQPELKTGWISAYLAV